MPNEQGCACVAAHTGACESSLAGSSSAVAPSPRDADLREHLAICLQRDAALRELDELKASARAAMSERPDAELDQAARQLRFQVLAGARKMGWRPPAPFVYLGEQFVDQGDGKGPQPALVSVAQYVAGGTNTNASTLLIGDGSCSRCGASADLNCEHRDADEAWDARGRRS